MIDITDFKLFLKKYQKNNGDYLLPRSIDQYCYHINYYTKKLDALKTLEEYILYMNDMVKWKKSNQLRAAFKLFLVYKGYEVASDGEIEDAGVKYKLKKLKNKQRSAFSSKRFMQSKVLSDEDVQRLIEKAPNIQMKTIVCFLFDLGLRRHELMQLKFRDLKFINPNDPNFDDEKNAGIYCYVNIMGKGQKSRTGYLHKTAVTMLRQLHPGEVNMEDNIFVFYKDEENNIKYASQTQELYEEFKKLGLKELGKQIHPHMARHTMITGLAKQGFSDSAMQNISGHASPAMLHKYVENTDITGRNAMLERGKDFIDINKDN